MNVRQLLATTDSREIGEWLALARLEYEEDQKRELQRRAQQREQELRNNVRRRGNR